MNMTYNVQTLYQCNKVTFQHIHFTVYMPMLCIFYKLVSEIVMNKTMLLDKEKKVKRK